MNSDFEEEIREFLIESNEGLLLLDQQIVQLEHQPQNQELISSVFRTIHSVKGTCGFFGFDILGSVTHITESILGQLREQKRELTPDLITLILEAVDAVKSLLARIEATGGEGEDDTESLRQRLEAAYRSAGVTNSIGELLRDVQPGEETPKLVGSISSQPVVAPNDAAPAPTNPTEPSQSMELDSAVVVISSEPLALAKPVTTSATTANITVSTEATDVHLSDSTIRVDVHLLNQLMTLVGELVLTRNQLLQSAGNFSPGVQQTSQRLNIITSELQESVMKTRMQPIGVVWSKLPRVVRDLSAKCGKQITLDMHGAETELDKSLIEAIRDPLTHIVRNSCDHGIETPAERIAKGKCPAGTLTLRAFHEAGAVNLEIVDDGAGIDPDRVRAKAVEKKLITAEHASTLSASECVNLIFLPGFSTAAQVTSISGRGVGMDVVKTNIEKISGSVQIVCPPTGGTTLRIKIPLTLAIIPGLIVSCNPPDTGLGDQRFVIPQSHLVEMTRIDLTSRNRDIDQVNGALIFRHRGNLLPLIYLSGLLHRAALPTGEDYINIIILQVQGRQFGLVVDRICDTQEIVVKPLGKQLKHLGCYGGATIMGDGRPALILDVGGIANLAGLDAQHKETVQKDLAIRRNQVTSEFILFRAGSNHRMALPLSIVNRLEELPGSAVEHAAGQAVARYRGELLPLLPASCIAGDRSAEFVHADSIRVIVINNGTTPFGLVVESILDIVEDSLSAVRGSANPALLGSAVIGGAVTDIVDATALSNRLADTWGRPHTHAAYSRRVAFYNPWTLGAETTYTLLNAAGYIPLRVCSAADLKDIVLDGVDVLLFDGNDTESPPDWMKHALRDGGALTDVPVVELTNANHAGVKTDRICIDRHNRPEILRTVERVIATPRERAA